MARQYTEAELRDITRQYLAKGANRQLIRDLAQSWQHRDHGPRRYHKAYEDDSLTLWVLGWRPGIDTIDHHVDVTPIHGHGASDVLVTCLEGEVDDDYYGEIDQTLAVGESAPCLFVPRRLISGNSLFIPKNGVHVMRCDEKEGRGFGLTLHAYSPRLRTMTYYDVADGLPWRPDVPGRLRLVDTWTDTDTDQYVPSTEVAA